MDYLFEMFWYGDFERWGRRVFVEHGERVRLGAKAQNRVCLTGSFNYFFPLSCALWIFGFLAAG